MQKFNLFCHFWPGFTANTVLHEFEACFCCSGGLHALRSLSVSGRKNGYLEPNLDVFLCGENAIRNEAALTVTGYTDT